MRLAPCPIFKVTILSQLIVGIHFWMHDGLNLEPTIKRMIECMIERIIERMFERMIERMIGMVLD
jgi:hypothetical protein